METRLSRPDLPTPDGVADAVLVRPTGEGSYPGVLLLMDAIGLRPQIDRMAERIAAWGYVVLAPNILYRAGRAPVIPLMDLSVPGNREAYIGQLMPVVRPFTPELMVRDAGAYLDALADLAPGPVGVHGYCFGGRMALLAAAAYPDRVAAVASFHGGALGSEDPNSPHRGVDRIRGEIYVGYADEDPELPTEQVERLEAALVQAAREDSGATYRTELNPGAPHGFTMADTPMYQAEAAERHFERLEALYARTLGPGGRDEGRPV